VPRAVPREPGVGGFFDFRVTGYRLMRRRIFVFLWKIGSGNLKFLGKVWVRAELLLSHILYIFLLLLLRSKNRT
jgi:hypothetical protein